MSLFENLVDELKEDNLLEETVIESVQINEKADQTLKVQSENEPIVSSSTEQQIASEVKQDSAEELPPLINSEQTNESIVIEPENIIVAVDETIAGLDAKIEEDLESTEISQKETMVIDDSEIIKEAVSEPIKQEVDEKDFYRRRALDEVNGLEMVDHVLSGVEREMMKKVPKNFDNYEVKQALHEFLQVAEDIKSPKHAEFEFGFMKETENWYTALAKRDKNVSVSHLRRYCETTKPSLSSQALMSLARFYRNSPYSETVRSKFDLVVSKLFSKDLEGGKRELVFEAEDFVTHIQELYADWSSTPLYSIDEDDSELLLAALKFQDFISEAENAESFDELVKIDFFKRLKTFKEKTHENFFAPILVAAAVESNVFVGNRFVDLINQERDEIQDGSLEEKYGVVHDKAISEATSKTLELTELLDEKKAESKNSQAYDKKDSKGKGIGKSKQGKESRKGLFGASPWLIVATIIAIIIGAVYFITSGSQSVDQLNSEISRNVKVVNLENSSLKEYVKSAKISDQTMFAITNTSWDKIAYAEKEEIVGKFIRTGEEKGFNKVHFLNSNGETVAFGSKEVVNIIQ